MDRERRLVDREGLGMKMEDMVMYEEVDSFGSEEVVGNHQSQMVVAQRSLLQILAEPSLLLRSC